MYFILHPCEFKFKFELSIFLSKKIIVLPTYIRTYYYHFIYKIKTKHAYYSQFILQYNFKMYRY